jgi:hypothetical protein
VVRGTLISIAFILGMALIAVAIGSLAAMSRTEPFGLEYLPPESPVIILSSPLGVLWEASTPHVSPLFRSGEAKHDEQDDATVESGDVEAGTAIDLAEESDFDYEPDAERPYLSALAQDLAGWLEAREIDLVDARDLEAAGIDTERSATLGFTGPAGTRMQLDLSDESEAAPITTALGSFTLVIGIRNQSDFRVFIDKLAGVEKSTRAGESPSRAPYDAYVGIRDTASWAPWLRQLYVAYPEDDVAVVSNRESTLLRALARRYQTAARTFRRDTILKTTKLLKSADSSWVALTANVQGIPWIDSVYAEINPGDNELRFRAQAITHHNILQVQELMLAAPQGWTMSLMNVTPHLPFVAGFQDSHLADYKGFAQDANLATALELTPDVFGRLVVDSLGADESVNELSFAAIEGRRGNPDWIAWIPMTKSHAAAFVLNWQSTLRRERDTNILAAARLAFREEKGADINAVDELIQNGYVDPSNEFPWSVYHLCADAESICADDYDPEWFESVSYVQASDGYNLRYILPPVTDNDLRYLLDEEIMDVEELKADAFRLCSTYLNGRLILATDGATLDYALAKRGLNGQDEPVPGERARADKKVQLSGSPEWILDQGLFLSSGEEDQDALGRFLTDLQHFRRVTIEIGTDDEKTIDVDAICQL